MGIYCLIAKKDQYIEDFPRLEKYKDKIGSLIINYKIMGLVDGILSDKRFDKSEFNKKMDVFKR